MRPPAPALSRCRSTGLAGTGTPEDSKVVTLESGPSEALWPAASTSWWWRSAHPIFSTVPGAVGGRLPVGGRGQLLGSRRSQAVVERHGATYVDPGRNLGFGAGVNVGLSTGLSGDCPRRLLLLNPDASIAPEAIARLQDYLLWPPTDLACVAPAQVDPETGEEARVGWPFPTPTAGVAGGVRPGPPRVGAPIS